MDHVWSGQGVMSFCLQLEQIIKPAILIRKFLSGEESPADQEVLETDQVSTVAIHRAMLNLVPVN
jgi:hypothetical protein